MHRRPQRGETKSQTGWSLSQRLSMWTELGDSNLGIPKPAWRSDPVPTQDDSSRNPPPLIFNPKEPDWGAEDAGEGDLRAEERGARRRGRGGGGQGPGAEARPAPPLTPRRAPAPLPREVRHLPGPAPHSPALSSGAVRPPPCGRAVTWSVPWRP